MKIIYCKYIPFKGYKCMTLLNWLIVREEYKNKINNTVIRHETIHSYQQITILLYSLILAVFVALFTKLSLLYVIYSLLAPIIIYLLCWIIEIVLPPYKTAYKDICFEREAKALENDPYFKDKLHTFSFIKYILKKR